MSIKTVDIIVITILSRSDGTDVAYEPTNASAFPEKSEIAVLRDDITFAAVSSISTMP